MISKTVEYALRAVVHLAEAKEGRTTEQIAEATQIPVAYLSKVLQQLSRNTIVQSQRGLGGGFTLKPSTKDLTVLDVVNAVDPIERIKECPLGLSAHSKKLCSLHKRLDEAAALVEKAFGNTSIAELISDPNKNKVYTFPFRRNKESTLRRRKL